MSAPSREVARDKLVELLDAPGAFTAVLGHEVKDLEGKSKVATVHSDHFNPMRDAAGGDTADLRHRFWISVWVRRDPYESDPTAEQIATAAASAEDDFDELAATVIDTVLANRKLAGFWEQLMFVDVSQPTYITLEGVQYRFERSLVETKHLLEPS